MTTTRYTVRPRKRAQLWGIPFLIPAVALLTFVILVPAVRGVGYAFTDWNGLSADFNWIGFDNFVKMANDPLARDAIWHTLAFTGVITVLQNVLGLALALAVNSSIKSKGLLRVIFFAPVIVTPVIVASLWRFIYLPNGPLDGVLDMLGLGFLKQTWIGNPDIALWSILGTTLWYTTGILMVIYLAGLQNVPDEIVEAAHLDGAGMFRRFFSIVLPQLKPALTIGSMLVLIGGLKTFDQVWIMTQGGPGTSTHTLSTAQYQVAFIFGQYGYASAFAVVLGVLAILVALAQQYVVRRKGRFND